jgi:hypothetical protein
MEALGPRPRRRSLELSRRPRRTSADGAPAVLRQRRKSTTDAAPARDTSPHHRGDDFKPLPAASAARAREEADDAALSRAVEALLRTRYQGAVATQVQGSDLVRQPATAVGPHARSPQGARGAAGRAARCAAAAICAVARRRARVGTHRRARCA